MGKEKKERRCVACGKLLIDEKIPFCRRCALEGRNKAAKALPGFALAATTILGARNLNHTDGTD